MQIAFVMACSTCDREIPDDLGVCPHCGRPQDPFTQNRRTLIAVALLTALLAAVFTLQTLISPPQNHQSDSPKASNP
jgi:hypothetical protein